MRLGKLIPLVAGVMLAAPAAASADFLHVVAPGESLSSVASADGLTVTQLAAANGISPSTDLVAGSTLAIPPQGVSSVAPVSAGVSSSAGSGAGSTTGDGDADSDDTGSAGAAAAVPASTTSASYVVQPGDTLSAIAARQGMSVAALAAENGLDPNAYLLAGSVLGFSGAGGVASASTATSQPVGAAAEGSAGGPPYPTPETVSASQIGSIAAANGVPSSLADAIGWQESGFNNNAVSSAGAVGVMQILPGTWQWINSSLALSPLSPDSANDNVTGGVLMLHSLLNATGGSPSMAAAGYYQGLPSVEKYGVYPSTQQYVNNVMSLASSFGGG